MERSLLDKLDAEVKRYQDKIFLKAAMAVCALTASADDVVKLSERCCIDHAIMTEPGLREFDFDKASEILDDYILALRQERESAKQVLYDKVRRIAGKHKRARTLMRVAYLIITADKVVEKQELREFIRLCGLLDLTPREVWQDLELTT